MELGQALKVLMKELEAHRKLGDPGSCFTGLTGILGKKFASMIGLFRERHRHFHQDYPND